LLARYLNLLHDTHYAPQGCPTVIAADTQKLCFVRRGGGGGAVVQELDGKDMRGVTSALSPWCVMHYTWVVKQINLATIITSCYEA